jgi:hypothetical protein
VLRITALSTNPAAAETAGSVGPDGSATLRHNRPAKTPARTLLITTIIAGADTHWPRDQRQVRGPMPTAVRPVRGSSVAGRTK